MLKLISYLLYRSLYIDTLKNRVMVAIHRSIFTMAQKPTVLKEENTSSSPIEKSPSPAHYPETVTHRYSRYG